ncbi:MAG: tetratricopeptide repeat protein [Chthoniobacterales bacterium]
MKRLVLIFVLAAARVTCAETASDLKNAIQPMTEGVPQVAVVRLRALLQGELTAGERNAATLALGEALVAAEKPQEALQILNDPAVRDFPRAQFARAQALAALARWEEALRSYQLATVDKQAPFHGAAVFGQAEAYRALGKVEEALFMLRSLESDPRWLSRVRLREAELVLLKGDVKNATRLMQSFAPALLSEKKERRLLRGRIEAWRNSDSAIELYESILKAPRGTTHSVLIATLFAIAEAHLRAHTPDVGDNFLEDFIEHYPADPQLPELFAKLDQLYVAERKQGGHELARWANDPTQPRRALALWYLARVNLRLGRIEAARAGFERLHRAQPPRLPFLAEAYFEDALFALQEGRGEEARVRLEEAKSLHPEPEVSNRIEMLLGTSYYMNAKFDEAAKTFSEIAPQRSLVGDDALYNATLAFLQAGQNEPATASAQELQKRGVNAETRGDLELEEALVQADRKDPASVQSLQKFLRDFPQHARVAEAHVALAELAFHAAPPRLDETRAELGKADQSGRTALASERAAYLRIWLEDAAAEPNEARVLALANDYLEKYPTSPHLADVRLKLAEIYYRRQDFASAQTQFEILAQNGGDNSALVERALFFAAKSAAQTMGAKSLEHALELFGEVVKRGGELKWATRNEQAVIERKLGKSQDAATLYEEVQKGDASPAEKREALCAQGDILYEEGAKDPENYRRAIGRYDELASQPEAAAHWRNQALFKKGICLEKLKEPAEALAAFYGIIEDETRPERQPEFFWYYKAGFNAARLLEEEGKWEPAAAVYEKLAFAGGSRSEEAKARLRQLRLEHFLWDQ